MRIIGINKFGKQSSKVFDDIGSGTITRIVTHSCKFHLDDVIAVSVAVACAKVLDRELVIERKDGTDFEYRKNILYIDVSSNYDPAKNMFDHHGLKLRREGRYDYEGKDIIYASAGLIWNELGKALISEYSRKIGSVLEYKDLQVIYNNIDYKLMAAVDAIDNGQGYGFGRTEPGFEMVNVRHLVNYYNAKTTYSQKNKLFRELVSFFSSSLLAMVMSEINDIEIRDTFLEEIRRSHKQNNKYVVMNENVYWRTALNYGIVWEKLGGIKGVIIRARGEYKLQAIPDYDKAKTYRINISNAPKRSNKVELTVDKKTAISKDFKELVRLVNIL